ncbi:phenazine antibiotic biosynthesis protein [Streptomyces sp. NPDC057620]|uniref:phenazine antibiotic biosynthesis protein n=1 Tax=Streptomyces sp. NPDC057620 TaxID=3346185 RepID=UPI003688E5D7
MPREANPVLELPFDVRPDPDEFIQAAMDWHFSPETGSPYWLERAKKLDFDPRADVKSFDDLKLFPNIVNELRDTPAQDLVPQGYGDAPDVIGVYESGGTTGAPKRVVCLADWMDRLVAWSLVNLDAHGFPRGANWLGVTPTGPHIVGELFSRSAAAHGSLSFPVDLDPRWVKRLIAAGRTDQADAYAEHVIDQAAFVLRTQDIGVMAITPPLLERLARRDELVDLVNQKVRAIRWGGTQMDADSRYLYRTEVFPDTLLYGHYGSTMILGIAGQRPGLGDDGPCVFDTFSPYVTFSVVNPETRRTVPYGERGQVVMNHISKSLFLPNNLERDLATRIEPLPGQIGDAVADIAPVTHFEDEAVIEGVY